MNISGFGNTDVNGTYNETGTLNGYPLYIKNAAFMLAYYPAYMPYRNSAGYYIIKTTRLYGANTTVTPKYFIAGTDATASAWEAMVSWDSKEAQIGTVS